jgi:hypothetical protein
MSKVVGLHGDPVDISPPPYKDPATMLRNIADDIEAGKYGCVETIVVALMAEDGYETFGGGKNSDLMACAYLFQACATRLHNIPWGGV